MFLWKPVFSIQTQALKLYNEFRSFQLQFVHEQEKHLGLIFLFL